MRIRSVGQDLLCFDAESIYYNQYRSLFGCFIFVCVVYIALCSILTGANVYIAWKEEPLWFFPKNESKRWQILDILTFWTKYSWHFLCWLEETTGFIKNASYFCKYVARKSLHPNFCNLADSNLIAWWKNQIMCRKQK